MFNDILDDLPSPKPAYNTISTIVRILVKKEFVGFKAFGKTHQYYPLISKAEYSRFYLTNFMGNYFEGSFQNLVSFFARDNDLDINDLNELLAEVKKDVKTKKAKR